MLFLRNKKNLNLCFRWHILRSYRFVAEVTFNDVRVIATCLDCMNNIDHKFAIFISSINTRSEIWRPYRPS